MRLHQLSNGKLICCNDEGGIQIWDPISGQLLATNFNYSRPSFATTILENSIETFVTGDWNGNVRIWNQTDASLVRTMTVPNPSIYPGRVGKVIKLSDGTLVACTIAGKGYVIVWNPNDGSIIKSWIMKTYVFEVEATKDGNILTAGDLTQVWNPKTGALLLNVTHIPNRQYNAMLLNNGLMATTGESDIYVFDPSVDTKKWSARAPYGIGGERVRNMFETPSGRLAYVNFPYYLSFLNLTDWSEKKGNGNGCCAKPQAPIAVLKNENLAAYVYAYEDSNRWQDNNIVIINSIGNYLNKFSISNDGSNRLFDMISLQDGSLALAFGNGSVSIWAMIDNSILTSLTT